MLGIRYFKASPTTYVLRYRRGKLVAEGPGLSFLYWAPTATLVAVPLSSVDAPFVFHEATADFQSVTIQGQLTYRVAEPLKLAALLDYSLLPNGKYASDDPQKLTERLVHELQTRTRAVSGRLTLREALEGSEPIGAAVLRALQQAELVATLGVQVLGFSILAIRPTPEMAKALEAEAREALQRRSDEAIYSRRNAAVVKEREIKESELATELAVEEKRHQIREAQMAAEIAIERERGKLIAERVENDRKDADAKAYALTAQLAPLAELDWRKLMMLNGSGDARTTIALAFQELATNAQKIGELNVSPDLLRNLLSK
jgi:hypothetical protein